MGAREVTITDQSDKLGDLVSPAGFSIWNELPSGIWIDIFVRTGNAKTMAALRMATATFYDLSSTSTVTDDYWRLRSMDASKKAPPPWMMEINQSLPRFRLNWKAVFDWNIYKPTRKQQNNCDVHGSIVWVNISAKLLGKAQCKMKSTSFIYVAREVNEKSKMITMTLAERVDYPTWFLDYVQPRITVRPSRFYAIDRTKFVFDKEGDSDVTVELHATEITPDDAKAVVATSKPFAMGTTNGDSITFKDYGSGLRWIKFCWTAPYREVAGRYSVVYTVSIPLRCLLEE